MSKAETMKKLATIDPYKLKYMQGLATDVDGTLTDSDNHFSPELLDMFVKLGRTDMQVVLVTGRPAGWVQAFVEYLPVRGGIAENGGVWCPKGKEASSMILEDLSIVSAETIGRRRIELQNIFNKVRAVYPRLKPTADCIHRLTDWTFPIHGLTEKDLTQIDKICQNNMHEFTFSSIHGHIKPFRQNKARGIEKLIQSHNTSFGRGSVITVGDSKNDEDMFDPKKFSLSIGVANIAKHASHMTHLPTFVTEKEGVAGFLELGEAILKAKAK